MSTKTTFKRIALVAVAALGLGVMSVAPSSATVSALAFSGAANGTSTNSAEGYVSDSTTAATVTVAGLLDAAGVSDTLTVSFVQKSGPATTAYMYFIDSATSGLTLIDTLTSVTEIYAAGTKALPVAGANDTSHGISSATGQQYRLLRADAGYVGAKLGIQLDSASARAAGTYTYTVIAKGYSGTAAVQTITQDLSIVVPAAVGASITPSALTSFARLNATSGVGAAGNDAAISSLATASGTAVGYVEVGVRNASNAETAEDSVTATITGAGILKSGSVTGTSFKVATTGDVEFEVLPDGRAGVGTITISTNGTTYAPKTVNFYAANAATTAAAANKPVIAVGANTNVIAATMKDSNGSNWAGQAYIYAASAADALIAGSQTPVACQWTATISAHLCPVTGTLPGTANFKVIDKATVAAATVAAVSNSVAVRVSAGVPTSVKLAFDKATYQPGEKAQVQVLVLDAAGLPLPEQTVANVFAAGGITSSTALGAGSDTLTAVFANIAGATSASAGTVVHHQVYTVYMPFASGDLTISATGGTSLPTASQVAVSATASVVNTSVDAATDAANEATDAANAATDAALASADAADAATAAAQDASDAVAALSTRVSSLIKDLRKQIRELTKLVQRLL